MCWLRGMRRRLHPSRIGGGINTAKKDPNALQPGEERKIGETTEVKSGESAVNGRRGEDDVMNKRMHAT